MTETAEEKTARVYAEAAAYREAEAVGNDTARADAKAGYAAGREWASTMATGAQLERLKKRKPSEAVEDMPATRASSRHLYHIIHPDASRPRRLAAGEPYPDRQAEYRAFWDAAGVNLAEYDEDRPFFFRGFVLAAEEYYAQIANH